MLLGKTAAFMLPILERLLYKPKQISCTRVIILLPTRELAVQVHQVSRQLAQFTNIDICIATGKSLMKTFLLLFNLYECQKLNKNISICLVSNKIL